jgi:hypothetical protein
MIHRQFVMRSPALIVTALIVVTELTAIAGCSRTRTADEALNSALKSAGLSREQVYPFAGKVMVDGAAPAWKYDEVMLVVLNDPEHLDLPMTQKSIIMTRPNGEFSATTYTRDDGIKAGKYILTFAVFQKSLRRGLLGPDRLNNLYNDPDKNATIAEFRIDHRAPGRTDYEFNLQLAGKEPAQPGPHSFTKILPQRQASREQPAR